jgi:AcrR family transcriptional regulator
VARTQSVVAHEKVISAALRLIGERGIEGTSMDAVAQESGVSKATVYNHWKDKSSLFIDVLNRLRVTPPEFCSGDPRRDLVDLVTHMANARRPGQLMRILPRMISYAAANPKFGREFQRSTTGPTEAQVARILNQAIAKGELSPVPDSDVVMSLLFGPILHRRLTSGKVPPEMPAQVVDAFWRSWSAKR